MKDAAYKWTELALKNWAVVVPIVLFLGSSIGLGFSMDSDSDKELELIAKDEQIVNIANHFVKTEKVGCNCGLILKQHLKKDH